MGLALALTSCSEGKGRQADAPGPVKWAAPAQHPLATMPTTSSSAPSSSPTATTGCSASARGRDFPVGPGQRYASLGDVPFETLSAGDTVRVFWRAEPYREKLMLSGRGSEDAPIRLCGVKSADGKRPVIDGNGATTRRELDFPHDGHQARGLVIVGHPHGRDWNETPRYIAIEGLEIRNGSPPFTFVDRAGKKVPYSNIVAGIFVERVDHLVIRDCIVTGNNNGIFTASGDDEVTLSKHILIERNEIFGNGSVSDYYEHNVYDEAADVVYQFNRFGAPRSGKSGVLGANIKERSAGVVIRYNWIEDGAHLLDIVDAQEAKPLTRPMPSFHATYVYGNVLIRGAQPSGSMIHYGGDSGILADYRKGTLFFYDNTLVVKNATHPPQSGTEIFQISTNDEHVDSRDNVYASSVAPGATTPIVFLAERDGALAGIASFAGDWIRAGWTPFETKPGVSMKARITGLDTAARGDTPGFVDAAKDDYRLAATPAGVVPVPLEPSIPKAMLPNRMYVPDLRDEPRPATLAIGALGR